MLATWVSPHYYTYQKFVKLATFKISYLKKRKWQKLMMINTFCVQSKFIALELKTRHEYLPNTCMYTWTAVVHVEKTEKL